MRPLSPLYNTLMIGKCLRAAAMVEVAMRQENFLDRHALSFDFRDDAIDVAAGIDDRSVFRRLADDDGTVLPKRVTGRE